MVFLASWLSRGARCRFNGRSFFVYQREGTVAFDVDRSDFCFDEFAVVALKVSSPEHGHGHVTFMLSYYCLVSPVAEPYYQEVVFLL